MPFCHNGIGKVRDERTPKSYFFFFFKDRWMNGKGLYDKIHRHFAFTLHLFNSGRKPYFANTFFTTVVVLYLCALCNVYTFVSLYTV